MFCVEIDECESSPCMNEGRCIDKISEYLCDCVAGYEGKQCEFGLTLKKTFAQNSAIFFRTI